MPYKVIRIKHGQKVVVSEHLNLDDAERKAGFIRNSVIVDGAGKVVPYG